MQMFSSQIDKKDFGFVADGRFVVYAYPTFTYFFSYTEIGW